MTRNTGKNRDSSCGNSKPLPALFILYPAMVGSSSIWSRKPAHLTSKLHYCEPSLHFNYGCFCNGFW